MRKANEEWHVVNRSELTERFLAGMSGRLSLVVAPLGFGKTTLLEQWQSAVEAAGVPSAYLSLEVGQGSETRLAYQFANTLPNVSNQTLADASEIDVSWMVDRVSAERMVLFLDDFHLAHEEDEHLVYEIAQRATGVHLVIASREYPKLPLAKLRLSGLVNDFGPDELRLDMDAAIALFPKEAAPQVIADCLEYTEGWPAALRLLQLAMKDVSVEALALAQSEGFQSDLATYLNEQFFRQLPEDVQDILVGTAHLNDINGDLANFTTERDDCWEQLEALAATHSLVSYRPNDDSYRYHQLLKDFLLKKQARLGEAKVSALNRRSADWFFRHNRLFKAIDHAVRAGEPGLGGKYLVNAGGVRIGFQNGAVRLSSLLELLPYEIIKQEPRLAVARSYELLKCARIKEAELITTKLREAGQIHDGELERDLTLVEAHMRVYSDRALRGDQLHSFAHTAHATPAENPVLRGLFFNLLCLFQYQAGQFAEARTSAETAFSSFLDAETPHLQFFMHLHLGTIDLDQGRVANATERYEAARDIQSVHFAYDSALWAIAEGFCSELRFEIDGSRSADLAAVIKTSARAAAWSEYFLATYETAIAQAFQAGGIEDAIGLIEQAERVAFTRPLPRFARHLSMLHLEYATLAEKEHEAARLAEVVNRIDDNAEAGPLQWRGALMRELALARYRAMFGDATKALSRLEKIAQAAGEQGYLRYAQRADVLCFLISAGLADKTRAVQHLTQSIERVPDLNGVFLREGDAFADAVRWTLRQAGLSIFPDLVRKKLGRLLNQTGEASALEEDFLAFFSPKERKVLPGLVAGASNKMIARDLGLTESTIKFHLKSIFAKLGVNSRKLAGDVVRSAGLGE